MQTSSSSTKKPAKSVERVDAANEFVQLAADIGTCIAFQPKKWRQVFDKSALVIQTNDQEDKKVDYAYVTKPEAIRQKACHQHWEHVNMKRSTCRSLRPSSRDEDNETITNRNDGVSGHAMKRDRTILPQLSRTALHSRLSLSEYLNHPEMVEMILKEHEEEQGEDSGQDCLHDEMPTYETPSVYRMASLNEERDDLVTANNAYIINDEDNDDFKEVSTSSKETKCEKSLVLPILKTISPRTREGLGRLPAPSHQDLRIIADLEKIAEEDNRTQLLYRSLKKQRKANNERDVRTVSRVQSLNTIPGSTGTSLESQPRSIVNNKVSGSGYTRNNQREEQIPMSLENINVSTTDLLPYVPASTSASVVADITTNTVSCSSHLSTNIPLRHEYKRLLCEQQILLVHEKVAQNRVDHTLTEIKKWVPLDVIYAVGLGKFASPAQQRATEILFRVGLRLKSNLLIQAIVKWKELVLVLKINEQLVASVRLQCWWRQLRAMREVDSRRRIRMEMQRRQQELLNLLARREEKSARLITKAIRSYAHRCQCHRFKLQHSAAERIQRFWRQHQAFWAALRIKMRKKQRQDAATCIQRYTRMMLARKKRRLLHKIARVKYRQASIEEKIRARKLTTKQIGAAIAIQRGFRDWVRRKVLALRRRRAQFEKDKIKILRVQAHFRGRNTRKWFNKYKVQVATAILIIQCSWRCYQARQHRQSRKATLQEQRKRWREESQEHYDRERIVPQQMKKKWNQLMTLKEKVIHSDEFISPEIKAAVKLQSIWRGRQLRQRLLYKQARAREMEHRRANKNRNNAAICIQRRVRGIIGRIQAWDLVVCNCANRIQSVWRGFRTRRELVRMQRALRGIEKLQNRWRARKNKAIHNMRQCAAEKIQKLARKFLSKRWLHETVRRQQFISEEKAMGKVLVELTRRRLKDELLIQSFIFKQLKIKEKHEHMKHTSDDIDDVDHTSVNRPLFSIDSVKHRWKRKGYDGVWQEVYRDASGGAFEIDNSRFARFLKALPHSFINKSSFTTQTIDLIFAKMKEPKARTISFIRFNKAMEMIFQEKFTRLDSTESSHESDHALYLKFMNKFVLPSTIQNGKYRKMLEANCTARLEWSVLKLRRFAIRIARRKQHERFLIVHQQHLERLHQAKCANRIKMFYHRYRFRLQMKAMLAGMFIEYIDHLGRPARFKHIQTGKTVTKRPIFLKGVVCRQIIPLPFPGEEFHAFCQRHEDSTETNKVPAEVYCVQCEDAMCARCFARDHSKRYGFQQHVQRKIQVCSYCATETATRECLQCGNGCVPFCDVCFSYVHQGTAVVQENSLGVASATTAKVSKHRYQTIVVMCIECNDRVAQWECETCQDTYCKRCLSSFHAKGQRQHHTCHRLSYFSVLKQQAEAKRSENAEKEHLQRQKQREKERIAREEERKLQEISATRIQALIRSYLAKQKRKAYMKLVRQTHVARIQRLKDEKIRSSVLYKLKNALGVAPSLKSDTKQEIADRQKKLEKIKRTLFFYHRTTADDEDNAPKRGRKRWTKKKKAEALKAANSWCTYDMQVKILGGEWKHSIGTILSTRNILITGFVLVFIPLANRSVAVNWEHIAPYDDDEILRQPYEPPLTMAKDAAHDFLIKLSETVEQATRLARLLYLQTVEFHDIVQYAWVVEYNKHEKREEYWNVVLNRRTFDVPKGMQLIERMGVEQRQEVEARVALAKAKLLDLLYPFQQRNKKKLALRRNAFLIVSNQSKRENNEQLNAIACARLWNEKIVPNKQFGGKQAAKFVAACVTSPHSTRDCWILIKLWQWMDLYEDGGFEAHAKIFFGLSNETQLYIIDEITLAVEAEQMEEARDKMMQLLKLKEETLQLLVFNASQQREDNQASTS